MVSNAEGTKTLAIQVKTTDWAVRTRGRGDQKVPAELQFPLGHKSAKIDSPNLLFAFVDLRGSQSETIPDVYIVPATFVADHCRSWVDYVKMVRFHIPIEKLATFKNNWRILGEILEEPTSI